MAAIPSLSDRYSFKENGNGLLRLAFTWLVLVSHSWPLGLGRPGLGSGVTQGQIDIGDFALLGFFILSGFLITGSRDRGSLGRYAWHRFLRILPGFWACLIFCAFVIAPLIALIERGTLAGFYTHEHGPFRYVLINLAVRIPQHDISGLLADVPYPPALNGSLWSLFYQVLCYVLMAALTATAALRRTSKVIAALTILGFAYMVFDYLRGSGLASLPTQLPQIAGVDFDDLIYLTYTFLLGACAWRFKDRLPMHGAIAAACVPVIILTALFGGFYVLAVPAFAYATLYLVVALPGRWGRFTRKRDLSYGMYIYAFPVQQLVAELDGARWGIGPYIAFSTLGTVVLAFASYHLVEKPVLRWKNWTPGFLAGPAPAPAVPVQPQRVERETFRGVVPMPVRRADDGMLTDR